MRFHLHLTCIWMEAAIWRTDISKPEILKANRICKMLALWFWWTEPLSGWKLNNNNNTFQDGPFYVSKYYAGEHSWLETQSKIAFMWSCEGFMQSKLWVVHDKFWAETSVLKAKLHHGSPHGAEGWHWILPMEGTLDPGTVGLAGWRGPLSFE